MPFFFNYLRMNNLCLVCQCHIRIHHNNSPFFLNAYIILPYHIFNYLSLNLPLKVTHFFKFGTHAFQIFSQKCQCPLGLMTHFYRTTLPVVSNEIWNAVSMPSRADDSFLQLAETNTTVLFATCQCPLGLMTHFYGQPRCTSQAHEIVSMPSRADDSFLRKKHSKGWRN